MAAVGLLRSIAVGLGTQCETARSPATTDRLRGDGDVAGMVRRHRNAPVSSRLRGARTPQPVEILGRILAQITDNSDTLAARLIDNFGSIASFTQASDEDLFALQHEGEDWALALTVSRRLLEAGLAERVRRTQFHQTRDALLQYLRFTLGGLRHERVVAFYLDVDGFVLAEQTLAEGEVDEVKLPIRHLVGRALALDARSVVLAHNHPSGSSEPSRHDIENTKRLKTAMRNLRLDLTDHFIVGANRVESMYDRGLI